MTTAVNIPPEPHDIRIGCSPGSPKQLQLRTKNGETKKNVSPESPIGLSIPERLDWFYQTHYMQLFGVYDGVSEMAFPISREVHSAEFINPIILGKKLLEIAHKSSPRIICGTKIFH